MYAALEAYVAELAKRLTATEEQMTNLRDDVEKRLAAERIASSRRASTSSASPTEPDIEPDNLSRYERRQRIKYSTCCVLRHVAEPKRGWSGETLQELRATVEALPCFGLFLLGDKIKHAWRLGHQPTDVEGPGFYEQPRVVMVEMVDIESKMELLRKGYALNFTERTRHISLDHAITVEQRRLRAAQWPQIQEAKAKGFRWFWSNVAPHKLIVATGVGVRADRWWDTGITP